MLKALWLSFLFCSLALANTADVPLLGPDTEQNPPSIDWKKIDTPHFEIIFQEGVDQEAQRVAHLLEEAYPLVARSLEVSPVKISLILQNQSTISNGFVTLAPRRSEWYMTPAMDPELTNTEWLRTLAFHEFRHVVQLQKSRRGFNRGFEIILGEIGQALGIGLTAPPWYLEGDAVGIETALTEGGRGRLPLFERDLRTLLLSGKDFDYDKAKLGSYEDYVPNHYVYGYFLTTYLRNVHGDLFLSKHWNRSAEWSINPLSFYNAYEYLTDEKFEKFYRQTMQDMIKQWKEKESKLTLTPYEVKNIPGKKVWTNYLYPQRVGEDKFLAVKKGLAHYDQFIITDGKEEKIILYPGVLSNEYPYKVRNGRFAYASLELDPRWGYRDYSRIRVYDLKEKKHVADLEHTKGRLAVLDHTGEFILYAEWSTKQGQHVVVKNLAGKEVYRLKYPADRVITSLDWLSHNEVVMVVKDHDSKKEIVKLSLLTQEETSLLPKSQVNHGFITSEEGKVLVESPVSGIDNIFLVEGNQLKQLTSARFGAYAPHLAKGNLYYNDYSVYGMNIVHKKMQWDEEQHSENSFVPFYEKLVEYEKPNTQKTIFDEEKFPVQDYSQLKNAFNLHSWIILAPPLGSTIELVGISRDIMNKFSLMGGAAYDLNEQELSGFATLAWTHYYPVFDLRAGYAGRNQDISMNGEKINNHWEEGTAEVGMMIPWKAITGRFLQSFTLRGFEKIIKVTNKLTSDPTVVSDGALNSPGAHLTYSVLSRMARRDLNPSLGFALNGHFEEGHDISGLNQRGSLLSLDSRYFLPGVMAHHSFFQQFAYEKQNDQFYQYASFIQKPRGTRSFFLDEFTKYSANYLFPMFYPDWHMSRYAYFKRISLNLFYDELNGAIDLEHTHTASTGWEVLFETHLLRLFIPITIGVRGNYVLQGETRNNYELFINTLAGSF